MKKIRVFIVDHSAVMKNFLKLSLDRSQRIEVAGTTMDLFVAAKKISRLNPDVLILDSDIPSALAFLSDLMISHPMPVIMLASLNSSEEFAHTTKEMGVVDVLVKPILDTGCPQDDFSSLLADRVLHAGKVTLKKTVSTRAKNQSGGQGTAVFFDVNKVPPKEPQLRKKISSTLIVIGASAGGAPVIEEILMNLPDDVPAIVVVIHMPAQFTGSFATRLNTKSRLYVKEAADGDVMYRGTACIAPGDRHVLVRQHGAGFEVSLSGGGKVNGFRPAVDVLFSSAAEQAGGRCTGILLTGMGSDGARGLMEIKESGGITIAQDEMSSAVFGMPRQAIRTGAAGMVKNIGGIISFIKSLE